MSVDMTYDVDMVCTNCGHKGRMSFKRGKEITNYETCPNCSCNRMARVIITAFPDRNWFAETCDVFFNGRKAKP